MNEADETLEVLVIRALSHSERKNILKIVASYPKGVNYTGILGESGLSTGKLNYHLGELTGFLERGDDRLYRVSELGKKAISVLEYIYQDIDEASIKTLNTKRARRLRSIRRRMDVGFYVITISMVGMTGLFGYYAWAQKDQILGMFTILFGAFSAFVLYMVDRSRKRDPDRILWFLEWLECARARFIGAGTQSALSIAIARAYASFVRGSLIIGIEEPELYLHPHACRHFYNILKGQADAGVQVVYTTHENCFVDIMDYEFIYIVKKNRGRTEVNNVRMLATAPSDELRLLSKCDESINEIFFAKHVIVVEGFGDKMSCHLALEKEGIDIDKENISIIDVGGSGEIKYVSDLVNRFNINCYAIFDEDPRNLQTRGLINDTRGFLGNDFVFLQSPNLEGLHGVPPPQKISKKFALGFLLHWYSQNPTPQVYLDLKMKMEIM